MLRGRPSSEPVAARSPAAAASDQGEPGRVEQPYRTGERPAGIVFARGPNSFWLPYHLLQGMRYEPEKLTLLFAAADVVIEGRGLHALYLELAHQVVWQIIEQGTRYAELSEAATCIRRIMEIPKGENELTGDGGARE